jgi:hypothetical protein
MYSDSEKFVIQDNSKSIEVIVNEYRVLIFGTINDKYFIFDIKYKEEHYCQIEDPYQHLQNMIADSGLTVEEWLLSFGFEKYDVPEGLLP